MVGESSYYTRFRKKEGEGLVRPLEGRPFVACVVEILHLMFTPKLGLSKSSRERMNIVSISCCALDHSSR